MERPPYLSSIPRYSAFHLPWSEGDRFPHPHHGGHDTECPEHTDVQTQSLAFEGLFSRNQTPRKIAMQLLRDSWIIFRDLKLEDWVKYAMGMPSTAISLFESYHNDLGLSLHSFLLRSPHDVDIFWEVAKVFYFPLHKTTSLPFAFFPAKCSVLTGHSQSSQLIDFYTIPFHGRSQRLTTSGHIISCRWKLALLPVP